MNLKFYDQVVQLDDGTFKGSIAPMFYLSTYEFKDLSTVKIVSEEIFINSYAEEINLSG